MPDVSVEQRREWDPERLPRAGRLPRESLCLDDREQEPNRQFQVYRVDSLTARAAPVGGNGAGPGEYRVPRLLAFDSDGSALVGSLPERRLLRYSPDGASRATDQVPLPAGSFAFGFAGNEVRVLATALADERGDSMPVEAFALDVGARTARRLFATRRA